MSEFKIVINDAKSGKSFSNNVNTDIFKNKKIGDKVPGDGIGFKDYEFQIMGGSDKAGFPMRKDVEGTVRRKGLFSKSGVGVNIPRRGNRIRKSVSGNSVSLNVSQVNLKVVKYGHKKIEEILGKEEKTDENASKEIQN